MGFAANVIVKDVKDIAWRLQLGSAFIPSFILGAGIFFCPESPRWLMKHNRHDEGFKSMLRLRAHPIIAARDFYYSYVIYEEELKEARGAGYFSRLWDCFAVPRIRRANYGASTVMIAQQMCGINSKLYLVGRDSLVVTRFSHFVLQLDHLPGCRLYRRPSLVCVPWLRCYPGCGHYSHIIFDRHKRPKNPDFDRELFWDFWRNITDYC